MKTQSWKHKFILVLLAPPAIALLILIAPILLATLLIKTIGKATLICAIRWKWLRHGKDMLIVTSDSPIWNQEMKTSAIDKYQDRAIVINWSQRSNWKRLDLPVLAFYAWLFGQAHTPSVIVFRARGRPIVFRFWNAFKFSKRGQTQTLEKMHAELLVATGSGTMASTLSTGRQ